MKDEGIVPGVKSLHAARVARRDSSGVLLYPHPRLYSLLMSYLSSVMTRNGHGHAGAFSQRIFLRPIFSRRSRGALGLRGRRDINVRRSAAPRARAVLRSVTERTRLSAFVVSFSWKLRTRDYLRFLSALQSADWSLKRGDMGLGKRRLLIRF